VVPSSWKPHSARLVLGLWSRASPNLVGIRLQPTTPEAQVRGNLRAMFPAMASDIPRAGVRCWVELVRPASTNYCAPSAALCKRRNNNSGSLAKPARIYAARQFRWGIVTLNGEELERSWAFIWCGARVRTGEIRRGGGPAKRSSGTGKTGVAVTRVRAAQGSGFLTAAGSSPLGRGGGRPKAL